MHGYKYRLRSPKNVVDEIENDIKLCPQVLKGGEFFFEDDTFTVDKKRAMDICGELERRGLKITFSVNARVDTADLELFKAMKEGRLQGAACRFESGDQGVLDKMHKGITLGQSRSFMEAAKKGRAAGARLLCNRPAGRD